MRPAWTCEAIPAATGRRCGHHNATGGMVSVISASGTALVTCSECGCTKTASDSRRERREERAK